MKYVNLNGISFSKVVCGTNAFYARSHFSEARNSEYRQRFTEGYLERLLLTCLNRGVNTVESCANERIHHILKGLNGQFHFIGNTRIDETSAMKSHQQKLTYLLETQHAKICLIHSQFVDRQRSGDDIKGLRPMLEMIRAAGSLAGVSTHRISTVEFCEEHDYPVDVYMFPLNSTGFVYPGYDGQETVEGRIELIQRCPKPFIMMKSLAAGRIPPAEGLPFVLSNCKPNDILSLGLGSVEEAEESLAIIEKHFGSGT